MSRALALALAALLSGCTYFTGDPSVLITSTPAGAEVLIDGQSTGQTTPVKVDLGGISGDDHDITVRKAGFADETRRVHHYTTLYGSRWIDGATDLVLPAFFLFWTFGDFLTPFGVRWRYVPHEVHVVLYERGQEPVTSDPAAGQPFIAWR